MTDLDTLTVRTRTRRRALDALGGEARATLLRAKEIASEIETLTETIQDLERVTILFNSMGEERQQEAQNTIEELVTRGLQTIFDDSLSFHIQQTTRGKSVIVDFIVRTTLANSVVDTPVLDARGGGLAATIGFLLRLVVLLLSKGTRGETLMVLDETFAHVSDDYLPGVGDFLREVVDKTGIQVLMVTHQEQFLEVADKVYRFSTVEGRTVVEERA